MRLRGQVGVVRLRGQVGGVRLRGQVGGRGPGGRSEMVATPDGGEERAEPGGAGMALARAEQCEWADTPTLPQPTGTATGTGPWSQHPGERV